MAEMKENLWKWREGGREKTKKSLERKKEITQEELEKKLEKLTKILDKESFEKIEQEEKEQKMRQSANIEQEKKRLRLERKRKAEEKLKTLRWVTKYLEENMKDFLAAIDAEKMIMDDAGCVHENLHSAKLVPPPTDKVKNTRILDTNIRILDTELRKLDTNMSMHSCASVRDVPEDNVDGGVLEDNIYKKKEDDLQSPMLQSVRVHPIVTWDSTMNDRSICQTGLPASGVSFNSSILSLAQSKEDWRAQAE